MKKDTVTMVKGDQTAEVTPDDSVKIMEGHGWKLAEESADSGAAGAEGGDEQKQAAKKPKAK